MTPGNTADQLWESELLELSKDLLNTIEVDYEFDVSLHAWMVGKNLDHARPTAVVSSQSKPFRTEAHRLLRRELSKHNFGVRTLPFPISRDSKISVLVDEERAEGVPRFLHRTAIKVPQTSRTATIGGEIQIDSERYGLTVAHVFDADYDDQIFGSNTPEVRFDEYSDEEDSGSASSTEIHEISLPPTNRATSETKEHIRGSKLNEDYSTQSRTRPPLGHHGSLGTSTQIGYLEDPPKIHRAHDWALINVDRGNISPALMNTATSSSSSSRRSNLQVETPMSIPSKYTKEMKSETVWVATGRRCFIRGRGLSSKCAIKIKEQVFVDTWSILLDDITRKSSKILKDFESAEKACG